MRLRRRDSRGASNLRCLDSPCQEQSPLPAPFRMASGTAGSKCSPPRRPGYALVVRFAALMILLLLVAAGLALFLTEGSGPDSPPAPHAGGRPDQPSSPPPGRPSLSVDDHGEDHRVTLDGVVYSGTTGRPIPGATVRALGLGAESVCTSSDTGEWSLQCAAGDGGEHHLRIEHPRYVPRETEWTRWSRAGTPVRIPPLFLLPIAAQIRGRVVGPDGKSVPLAQVRVFHNVEDGTSFPTEFQGVHQLDADEQGLFGPVPVPPGTVTVQANSIDLPDFGVGVMVAPGPMRTIEVEVVLPAPEFVTGSVVDKEGRPLKATIVGWVREIETDPEGRFRVPLLSGEFARISARREGFRSTDLFRRQAFAGLDVQFELRPALDLSGTVLEADGSPARAGLRVRCNIESTLTVEPGVIADVSDIALGCTTTLLITDEHGVPLPDAWLRIPTLYNETVKMADGAGMIRTLATRGFVTAPGREVIRLARDTYRDPWRTEELTFSLRPSTPVTGRLVDRKGRPLPGQSIEGAPGEEVMTDGRGRFRIEGIPDGHPVELTAELSDGIRVTAGVGGGDRDVVMQVPEMRRIRVRLIEASPDVEETRDLTWVLYESLGHGVSLQVAKGTLPLSPEDRIVTLESPPHADVLKLRCGPGTWRIYTGLHRQDTELEYDFPKFGKTVILVRDADREPIEGASIREAGTGAVLGKTNDRGFWISEPDDRVPSGVLPLVVAAEGYVEHIIAARDLSTNAFEELTLRTGGTVPVRIVGTSFARVFVLLPDGVSGEWDVDSTFLQFRRHLRPGRQRLLVCPQYQTPFVVPVEVREGESTEVVIRVP